MDSLTRTGLVLLALLGAHILDHSLNQPARDLPALGGVVGVLGFAIVALAVILAIRRNPYAPEAAIAAGAATILGFVVVHLLPDWTPLSDPYWAFDADALSWLLIIAPVIAAGALTVAGFQRLGGERGALPA